MTRIGDRIRHHLEVLVDDIGARPPGSPANRRATDHVRASLTAAGRPMTALPFTTRWWEPGTGWLEVNGARLEVDPNPYSPPGAVHGRAVHVGQLSALEALDPSPDAILVLTDELAREQVLPAVFPFLSLPDHERIRAALHRLEPVGIVVCAHLDSKATTPGAFDNAAGVATLLALTEVGHLDGLPLELVLFNGEDHVDSCGEPGDLPSLLALTATALR